MTAGRKSVQVEGNDGPGTLLYGHDFFQSTQQDAGDPAMAASEDAEGENSRYSHLGAAMPIGLCNCGLPYSLPAIQPMFGKTCSSKARPGHPSVAVVDTVCDGVQEGCSARERHRPALASE